MCVKELFAINNFLGRNIAETLVILARANMAKQNIGQLVADNLQSNSLTDALRGISPPKPTDKIFQVSDYIEDFKLSFFK